MADPCFTGEPTLPVGGCCPSEPSRPEKILAEPTSVETNISDQETASWRQGSECPVDAHSAVVKSAESRGSQSLHDGGANDICSPQTVAISSSIKQEHHASDIGETGQFRTSGQLSPDAKTEQDVASNLSKDQPGQVQSSETVPSCVGDAFSGIPTPANSVAVDKDASSGGTCAVTVTSSTGLLSSRAVGVPVTLATGNIACLTGVRSISESPAYLPLLCDRGLSTPTVSLSSSSCVQSEVDDGSDDDTAMEVDEPAAGSPGAHQSVSFGHDEDEDGDEDEDDEDEDDEDDDEDDEDDDDDDDDVDEEAESTLGAGGDGITRLLQAAEAELTPGIAMLAAAAQNATPAGFPCPHCNKTYPMASGLRRHIKRTHAGAASSNNGNPFTSVGHQGEKRSAKCSFCQADLPQPATQAVRRQHMRGECSKNPYTCALCDKVFVSPGGLQRHSLLHNGKRPFQCTVCNKEFTQASHLKVHMNGHTGEKPYQCDHEDCNKTYSDPSSLRSHKLAHAGIKSKKKRNPDAPYLANPKCAYCDRRFVSRAARDQHARECSSNPYRCMICQKACLGMVKLERHIRSHSRSRVSSLKAQELAKNKKTQSPDPKCAYCVDRFPTRVVRDRHSRMCANNPYRCKLCFKAFLGSAKLLRHARSHAESNTHGSAAIAAAIDHATALAAAGPGPGSPTGVLESSTSTSAAAAASCSDSSANGSAVADPTATAATCMGSGQLPTVLSSAGLSNIVVPPGSHPLIAVQTPLGFSLVPNPFSSVTPHHALLGTSSQQLGRLASPSQTPASMDMQRPVAVEAIATRASEGAATGSNDNCDPAMQTTQLEVHGQAQPERSLEGASFSSMVADVKLEEGADGSVVHAIPLMPTIPPPSGSSQVGSPSSSQTQVQSQAPTFLASIPTPFSYSFPFTPNAGGVRTQAASNVNAQFSVLDNMPGFLQAILGVDPLGGPSAAVLQHMQQFIQMQSNLMQQQQQQEQQTQEQQQQQQLNVQPGSLVKEEPVQNGEESFSQSSLVAPPSAVPTSEAPSLGS